MREMLAQILAAGLEVLGALPLMIYPAVVVANVMSAAARPKLEGTCLLRALVRTFLVGTTTYPVIFLLCLLGARYALWRGAWAWGVILSGLPLLELAALGGLMALWGRLEKNT